MRSIRHQGILSCTVAVLLIGCATPQAELAGHRKAIASIATTAAAIRDAWLSGSVSAAYAQVALERSQRLLEQDRQTLALAPEQLNDPQGAKLSQAAEHLSRAVARMTAAVAEHDSGAMRSVVVPDFTTEATHP
jgi:hypothetical protein